MSVTIEDIAKKVGRSITTVSRALHDYDDVSPKTKARVRRVAEEMGYTPSVVAQRLQKQRTDTIGLIIPTFGPRFSDPFFSEFMAGIGNKTTEHGYDMLVSTRPPGEEEMKAYRTHVQGRRVDGFIIVRTRLQDSRIDYLREIGFPFVAFGRTEDPLDYAYVDEDGALGMHMIASYLVERGHTHFAYISAPVDLTFCRYRLNGFQEGLAQHGINLDPTMVLEGDLTQSSGYQLTEKLLDIPHPPTAIVACNDLMAFGAIASAQERGLVVGKDIAITGFDDIPMAEHFHPSLTTVHQPIYQIGSMVCEILIKQILGEKPEQEQIILKPSLIIRQSCGNSGGDNSRYGRDPGKGVNTGIKVKNKSKNQP
jgi:LacI family transcriptional regulator